MESTILNTKGNQPSINLKNWQKEHKDQYAIVKRDRFNSEYGWILASGTAKVGRKYSVTEQEAILYGEPLKNLFVLQALAPVTSTRKFSVHRA